MIFKVYKEPGSTGRGKSLVKEVLGLVHDKNDDSQFAGLDFARALKSMASSGLLLAAPLPRSLWVNKFRPSESLWARETRRHSLYVSRISPLTSVNGLEVRALFACNGILPEPDRVLEAASRHKQM
jgi:hypothetical protein